LADIEERHRAVGLGIEVDEKRWLAAQGKPCSQIDRGGGLSNTAFLIGDGNNHCGAKVILGTVGDESKK
jgi:hypothetical protein